LPILLTYDHCYESILNLGVCQVQRDCCDPSHHKRKTSLLQKIHKNVANKSFQKDWGLENIYIYEGR
jgi:hypothetical protein